MSSLIWVCAVFICRPAAYLRGCGRRLYAYLHLIGIEIALSDSDVRCSVALIDIRIGSVGVIVVICDCDSRRCGVDFKAYVLCGIISAVVISCDLDCDII